MRNRVREQRTQQEMSQAELAAALGVSRQTVISIESGRYLPSLPLAFTIARFFGLRHLLLGALLPDPVPHDVKVPLHHQRCQATFTRRLGMCGGLWSIRKRGVTCRREPF